MSLGLYLHIPYCFSKCRYCDFYSHPGERSVPDAYVELFAGASRFAPEAPLQPDTLYFGGGTAQPATETLAYALRQLGYQVDLDDKVLVKMADFFKGVRADFLADGTLDPISMATDTQCLNYQIPGGMLSNLISQLKMMNAIDKLDEALAETPKVRADLGYPPLVTPTSQIVALRLC